jgi:hypothetical protein
MRERSTSSVIRIQCSLERIPGGRVEWKVANRQEVVDRFKSLYFVDALEKALPVGFDASFAS